MNFFTLLGSRSGMNSKNSAGSDSDTVQDLHGLAVNSEGNRAHPVPRKASFPSLTNLPQTGSSAVHIPSRVHYLAPRARVSTESKFGQNLGVTRDLCDPSECDEPRQLKSTTNHLLFESAIHESNRDAVATKTAPIHLQATLPVALEANGSGRKRTAAELSSKTGKKKKTRRQTGGESSKSCAVGNEVDENARMMAKGIKPVMDKKVGGEEYDEETVQRLFGIMRERGWKDKARLKKVRTTFFEGVVDCAKRRYGISRTARGWESKFSRYLKKYQKYMELISKSGCDGSEEGPTNRPEFFKEIHELERGSARHILPGVLSSELSMDTTPRGNAPTSTRKITKEQNAANVKKMVQQNAAQHKEIMDIMKDKNRHKESLLKVLAALVDKLDK